MEFKRICLIRDPLAGARLCRHCPGATPKGRPVQPHERCPALANGYGGTRVVISEGWTGSKGGRRGRNSKRKEMRGEGNAKTATVKAKKGIG